MIALMLTLLTAAPTELKLAMPAWHAADLTTAKVSFYSEQLATEMLTRHLRVVTEREMGALLGLERQKQMLGCGDSGCMVELANALGADGVVLADVARVGSRFQASLRVIDARSGAPLSVYTFKADDEEGLVDGLAKAAAQFAVEVPKSLGRVLPQSAVPSASTSHGFSIPRRIWWVPAIATVLVAGAGISCFVAARGDYAMLDPTTPGSLTYDSAQSTASQGRTLQTVSMVLFVTGAAFALVTAAVGAFGSHAELGVALAPGGGSLSLAGSFP